MLAIDATYLSYKVFPGLEISADLLVGSKGSRVVGALRILIAEDHEVARQGIRSLLESHPGWEVCAEAKDGREAVETATRFKPDILLLVHQPCPT